jgi:phospho-N-acetylmuramoyl-pentapeptide-transferase
MNGWLTHSDILLWAILIPGVLSLGLTLLAGGPVIRKLQRFSGERIDSASEMLNALHASKAATPTMGGLLVLGAVSLTLALTGALRRTECLISIGVMLILGGVGFVDDWIKLRTHRRGLTARHKLLAQLATGLGAGLSLYFLQTATLEGTVESGLWFRRWTTAIHGTFWIVPWTVWMVVSTSNAVNLTDGLDGLAAGSTVICGVALTSVMLLISGEELWQHAGGLSTTSALTGSLLGFLWFNRYPARVFLGDTGALAIGGLFGVLSVVLRVECVFAILAGVMVIETLSVIVQVAYYRLTGRRLLLCSPLHNHFVFRRMPETRIVRMFWVAGIVLAVLGIALSMA